MQILTLEFEGIGPFADRQFIDFRELGVGGLFLLEGPTGAGKTTIIDAIVFALYGDVSGGSSTSDRIVSTKLSPGVTPFTTVTVETSKGLLKVRRVPAHQRQKLRGKGFTPEPSSVQLWKLPDVESDGELLTLAKKEADLELREAIGLDRNQFTQTVVLPQGDFATFLRASPEERRMVLQHIFGTEVYQRCAEKLADMASQHKVVYNQAKAAFEAAAAGFRAVAWAGEASDEFVAAAAETGSEQGREALKALSDARLEELAEQADVHDEQVAAASAALEKADHALRAVIEHNQVRAEHARLRERQAALHAQAAEVAVLAEKVQAALRAEQVERSVREVHKAQRASQQSDDAREKLFAQVWASADADLVEGDVRAEMMDEAAAAAREVRSALQPVVDLERGLAGAERAARTAEKDLAARRITLDEQQQRVESDRQALEQAVARAGELRVVADTCPALKAEVDVARHQRDAVAKLDALSASLGAARVAETRAADADTLASHKHKEARRVWLGGMAGILAGDLVEGEPCAVCGSAVHPHPATLPDDAVTREQVEELEAKAEAANRALKNAQVASSQMLGALEQQRDIAGELNLAEADEALREAGVRLQQAEAARTQWKKAVAQVETLEVGIAKLEAAIAGADKDIALKAAACQAERQKLEQQAVHVQGELAGFASVWARVEALAERVSWAQKVAASVRQSEAAGLVLDAAVTQRDEVLAHHGFADEAEATRAILPASERTSLAGKVKQHETETATVAELLAQPKFGAVDQAQDIPEEPVREAQQAAKEVHQQAVREQAMLTQNVNQAGVAMVELDRCAERIKAAALEGEAYVAMAELANASGGGGMRMTLPTFVLLRRFEEVIELANERLGHMTQGRYSLRRTDEKEGTSLKQGLGLQVIDHAGGDTFRDPKTLSGGETFQASLALALGLADAVTAEAGGVELSTLFVDEGFGSLDGEALDMVMTQLNQLSIGGRSVGIVSHVDSLKHRIADRITVVPRGDGVSTLVTTAGS